VKAALLACTSLRSGVCLIPLWTGFYARPVEYPWPRVVFRRWGPVRSNGPLNGNGVFFKEPA